jgi:hypothetical protein
MTDHRVATREGVHIGPRPPAATNFTFYSYVQEIRAHDTPNDREGSLIAWSINDILVEDVPETAANMGVDWAGSGSND